MSAVPNANVTPIKKKVDPEKRQRRHEVELAHIKANPHLRWRLTVFGTIVAGLTIPAAFFAASWITTTRIEASVPPPAPPAIIMPAPAPAPKPVAPRLAPRPQNCNVSGACPTFR